MPTFLDAATISDFMPLLIVVGIVYFMLSFLSAAVGLAILAFSMLFSPEFSLGLVVSREVTLRAEDLLIPILLVASLGRTAVFHRSRWFIKTPLNLPIVLLLFAMCYSTAHGGNLRWVIGYSWVFYIGKVVEYFAVFFLVISFADTEKRIRYLFVCSLFTLAVLTLYMLPQISGIQLFQPQRITAPFESGTPQPATAGGYMAFFLLILFSLFVCVENRRKRFIIAVFGLVVFLPFLYTLNRTSYLAFLGGLVIVAVLCRKRWIKYFLLGFLVLSPFLAPAIVKERIAYTWEDAKLPGRKLGVDYSFQERILSFRRAWDALSISPVFGLGVTSSYYIDNQYTRTLHEIGPLGLALWLWVYLRLFRIGRWLYRNLGAGWMQGLALGYSAGVIGILIHAFGSVTFYVVRIMEPFWFISGLVVSLYLIKTREWSQIKEEVVPESADYEPVYPG